jgi:hypothetical protein
MPDRTCTHGGCGSVHYAKGLCKRHYRQQPDQVAKEQELQSKARGPRRSANGRSETAARSQASCLQGQLRSCMAGCPQGLGCMVGATAQARRRR